MINQKDFLSKTNVPKLLHGLLLSVRFSQTTGALLFFTLISCLMLYPLIIDFFDKLALGGDAYEYVWKLWWFKHTLLETGQSPWVVPEIYFPYGYLLAYGEATPANTILALPLTWLLGEIPTYNLLVLLSTILSGFTMFLLAREVSGNFWAGLLAGVIYAFSPFRRLQILHLNILTTQWLPLIFYFLERFLKTRNPIYGLVAGLSFGLNALASWYYAVAGALFVGLWSLFRMRPLTQDLNQKQSWHALGLFIIVTILLVGPFVWPYLMLVGNPDTTIPIENSNFYSASLVEYLIPSPFQFLWGQWVFQNLLNRPAPGEFVMGWGFTAWLFGLYAVGLAPRYKTRPWLVLVIVAILLSFGLTLHVAGRQVVIPAPQPVIEKFNDVLSYVSLNYALNGELFTISREDGLIIPLPALFLRWFVPVIGKVRTWTRFSIIALSGVAVLAALGATAWQRREIAPKYSQKVQHLFLMAVIGFALFELWWAPLRMIEPNLSRPVDHWLATQPDNAPIIEYPLSSAFTAKQFIYTRTHNKPIVHGYATYFSFVFSRRHPELLNFPGEPALQQLAQWGVRYVLVETAAPYTDEAEMILADMNQESCLQQRTVQATVYVFELAGCN